MHVHVKQFANIILKKKAFENIICILEFSPGLNVLNLNLDIKNHWQTRPLDY